MAYPSYRINRRDIWEMFIVLVLALAARAAYFCDYRNTEIYPLLPYSDGYSYFLWAKDIASGSLLGSAAFMKWPLYAYFLGFLFKAFGSNVTLVYTLQFTLGAINCVLVYFIARIIFGRRTALLAGLSCAWYSAFIFYDGLLIYNSLSIFLNSLLFLFILRARGNPGKAKMFWIGIILGICTIAQASILIFGVLAAAWIIWRNRSSLLNPVYNFSCFVLGLSIVIGSVISANYLAEKDFVLIAGNTGFNFYSGNNPGADGLFYSPFNIALNQDGMFRDARVIAESAVGRHLKTSGVSGFWFNKSAAFIKDDPSGYAKLLLRKLEFLFSPDEFFHEAEYRYVLDKAGIFKVMFTDLRFILPFAFLGMFLGLRRFRETALLYLALITMALSIALFYVTTRYRLGMVPFLVIFSSYGIYSLWEALRHGKYMRSGYLCIALLLAFILSGYTASYSSKIVRARDNPLDFRYHLGKAVYYNDKSDYQSAMSEIERAYRLQPDNHYCLLSYGTIYYNMRDFKAAEAKFNEAVRVFPLSVDAYYNLGLLYNQQRRFDEAVAALSEAVSLDPQDVGAHFELGKAYKGTGQYKEAEAELFLALKKINRWRTEERAAITEELAGMGR